MAIYDIIKEKYKSVVKYLFENPISKENEKLRIENNLIEQKIKDLGRILEEQDVAFKELSGSNTYPSSLENLK